MSNDPDLLDPDAEECPYCSGTGMWSETVEAAGALAADADLDDSPCPHCDGTGFEP